MRIPKNQFIKVLKACNGIPSETAKRLGVSSHAVRKRLRANPDLKAIADECIATSLDYAEMTIVREIMQGNIRVCMWYLDRFGKARGYGKNAKFKIQPTPRSSVVLYALERTV